MKHIKSLVITAVIPTLFCSVAFANESSLKTEQDKVSYSLGAKTAENFNAQQIKINAQQFSRGMNDVLSNKKTALTNEEMQQVLTKFQQEQVAILTKREKQVAATNLAQSNKFFETNKKEPGVKTTASGLQYIEITQGKGNPPKATDTVTVNYRGTLLNGTEFDSSASHKDSNTFEVSNLIPGWQEALQMMKPGAKWKIFVPPQLAYGTRGAGQVIEPNSALIFEIELVSVKPNA